MKKILIVEDNKLMAEILAQVIRRCESCEIVKVNNINSAQRLLISASYQLDGIFLDLNIEKPLDGLELLKYIKQHLPEMPTAVITSESQAEVVKEVLTLNPHDYLIKPISMQKVQRSLSKFEATKASAAQAE
ncbi:response regulator [Photobacterium sp. TY1-4]|uniref:response regulator n=1 Tax=Photobacterium sp. TY1-4 TaxID=2899122 RepID=UPI0021C25179|nr:response regulator [Photobacterium sp. TY1-4]UXI02765.1 response regulator [Photobacterium sp. TY1-4]